MTWKLFDFWSPCRLAVLRCWVNGLMRLHDWLYSNQQIYLSHGRLHSARKAVAGWLTLTSMLQCLGCYAVPSCSTYKIYWSILQQSKYWVYTLTFHAISHCESVPWLSRVKHKGKAYYHIFFAWFEICLKAGWTATSEHVQYHVSQQHWKRWWIIEWERVRWYKPAS